MSRRAQENAIAVMLLMLFSGVIVLCLDFGPRARMIPLPLAIFGIVLTVIQIVWQNIHSANELRMEMISVSGLPVKDEKKEEKPDSEIDIDTQKRSIWRSELGALGMVAILLALVLCLGPIPAIFLFTGGYFLFSRQYSWGSALIYTAVFTAAVYLMFDVALDIQPYHGLLAPVVERFK